MTLQTGEVRPIVPATQGKPGCGGGSHLSYFKRALRSQLVSAYPGWQTHLPKFRPRKAGPKAGLAYEAKILKALAAEYRSRFLAHLPFHFNEGNGRKVAIPDALLFSPDYSECCVVEIKIRHTADAYHQLNDFYIPIVHRAFGRAFRVSGLEICKYYDPLIKLPRPAAHLVKAEEVFETREGFHPILLWSRFDGRVA